MGLGLSTPKKQANATNKRNGRKTSDKRKNTARNKDNLAMTGVNDANANRLAKARVSINRSTCTLNKNGKTWRCVQQKMNADDFDSAWKDRYLLH